ncbi:MAG: T9SS type A sorting domain-containing protein [candidate division Zixibacteria bacterium]|nr:T9SS type A sorting domain-containing protein [Candidatus Tariuqbacter arcticus]
MIVKFRRINPDRIRQLRRTKRNNLSQNYPNPFNPVTSIKFSIPKVAIVKISVYNILGREVAVLADREYQAGEYIIRWEAANVSSGIYFIYMEAADYHRTLEMVLLR